MRKHASGSRLARIVVGGLVGLYLLGGALFFFTALPHELPGPAIDFCITIYTPVIPLLLNF